MSRNRPNEATISVAVLSSIINDFWITWIICYVLFWHCVISLHKHKYWALCLVLPCSFLATSSWTILSLFLTTVSHLSSPQGPYVELGRPLSHVWTAWPLQRHDRRSPWGFSAGIMSPAFVALLLLLCSGPCVNSNWSSRPHLRLCSTRCYLVKVLTWLNPILTPLPLLGKG